MYIVLIQGLSEVGVEWYDEEPGFAQVTLLSRLSCKIWRYNVLYWPCDHTPTVSIRDLLHVGPGAETTVPGWVRHAAKVHLYFARMQSSILLINTKR